MLKKIFIIFLLLINIVLAAKIQGVIYDNSLNKVSNVIVEISPLKQRYIAKYGVYNFEIPLGTYLITAKKNDIISQESITIDKEGVYNLDLVLFPSFEEEEELLNETNMVIESIEGGKNHYEIYGIIALLIILIIWRRRSFLKLYRKTKKLFKKSEENKELADDLEEIIKFIKNNENRTTQKEIRQHLNLSEAKISLMVAELQSLNKIKKIKKGRGNIIILNDRKDN